MNALLQQCVIFSRRFPIVVISLTAFILLAVANYYLWQRQQLMAARHEDARRSGEAMVQSLTTHPRIAAELTTVKQALDLIDRNLIVESDLAANLGYFYQIETQIRVRLSQVNQLSSQPPPEGNPYKAVPFSLRIIGTYNQLISLLHELETGPRLLKVKSCNIARTDPKTNALTMDLTVDLLASR